MFINKDSDNKAELADNLMKIDRVCRFVWHEASAICTLYYRTIIYVTKIIVFYFLQIKIQDKFYFYLVKYIF